jgi:hypothetical protein
LLEKILTLGLEKYFSGMENGAHFGRHGNRSIKILVMEDKTL